MSTLQHEHERAEGRQGISLQPGDRKIGKDAPNLFRRELQFKQTIVRLIESYNGKLGVSALARAANILPRL